MSTSKPLPSQHQQEAGELALLAMPDIQAITRLSRSWIHEAVAAGRFPQPVMRRPRCTRWRKGDVDRWLAELSVDQGAMQ